MIAAECPLCAVCKHPVEGIQSFRDPLTGEFVFTVWCHGQEETARLSEADQMNMNSMTLGPAFAGRPMLEATALGAP
jgi:hypothetical protein